MVLNVFDSIKQVERVMVISQPFDQQQQQQGVFEILVFAERWIRVYEVDLEQKSAKLLFESKQFLDKIYDVIVPGDYSDGLYVGYAHNYVDHVTFTQNGTITPDHTVTSVICEDECILFQLRFCPRELRNDKTLVAAATMFGSVSVWDYTSTQSSEKVPVLYEFKGHQGVIYNLRWITDQSLCSTSGDRCVKVWNFDIPDDCRYAFKYN